MKKTLGTPAKLKALVQDISTYEFDGSVFMDMDGKITTLTKQEAMHIAYILSTKVSEMMGQISKMGGK